MKKLQLFIILFPIISISQDRISASVGNNEIYIETYKYYEFDDSYTLQKAYRLGPSSAKVLKDGIKTAVKWAELNQQYNREFNKEISRFSVMEKEIYKFYKKYINEFSDELIMTFKGLESGEFEFEIKNNNDFIDFIRINDLEMLINFQNLINGKSVNNEIDELFKK